MYMLSHALLFWLQSWSIFLMKKYNLNNWGERLRHLSVNNCKGSLRIVGDYLLQLNECKEAPLNLLPWKQIIVGIGNWVQSNFPLKRRIVKQQRITSATVCQMVNLKRLKHQQPEKISLSASKSLTEVCEHVTCRQKKYKLRFKRNWDNLHKC